MKETCFRFLQPTLLLQSDLMFDSSTRWCGREMDRPRSKQHMACLKMNRGNPSYSLFSLACKYRELDQGLLRIPISSFYRDGRATKRVGSVSQFNLPNILLGIF